MRVNIWCPLDSEVIVRTGGGGGWGDPLDRDPELVRGDVIEGFVSRHRAQQEYGVVVEGAGLDVDRAATQRLRAEMKQAAAALTQPANASG